MNDQLILSAANGDTDKVLVLLQNGININTTDRYGRTPVLAATYNNQVDTVKVLIQHGADINIRDNNLENVLLHAGASGYLEIVKLAISARGRYKAN